MYRILAFLLTLTALGFGFTACNQDPNSTTESGNFMDQPMAAKGGGGSSAPANPKIVYVTKDGYIAVMDTTGTNQTTVYTPTRAGVTAISPNWSPSNSIVWSEYPTTSSSAIRAADISVSNGTPVSSNVRTIASLSTSAPNYHSIRNARWSSLSTTNKIAFSLNAAPAGGANHHVCLVSASGGAWDTIYSTPNDVSIIGLAWNYDDTRLAVLLRKVDAGGNFVYNSFVVISPSDYNYIYYYNTDFFTGDVIDTIPVSMELPYPNYPFDWSRDRNFNDINKLVFVAGGKIYYLTARSEQTPTTNNVSAMPGTVTWSPSNNHLMFVNGAGQRRNKSTGAWETVYELTKNTAQTTTVTTLDSDFPHYFAMMNWHR